MRKRDAEPRGHRRPLLHGVVHPCRPGGIFQQRPVGAVMYGGQGINADIDQELAPEVG